MSLVLVFTWLAMLSIASLALVIALVFLSHWLALRDEERDFRMRESKRPSGFAPR